MADKLTTAEALIGFASWLTTLEEPITLSARHNAAIAGELVTEFMEANRIDDDIRENWTDFLTPPTTRPVYDMNSDEGPTPEPIPWSK